MVKTTSASVAHRIVEAADRLSQHGRSVREYEAAHEDEKRAAAKKVTAIEDRVRRHELIQLYRELDTARAELKAVCASPPRINYWAGVDPALKRAVENFKTDAYDAIHRTRQAVAVAAPDKMARAQRRIDAIQAAIRESETFWELVSEVGLDLIDGFRRKLKIDERPTPAPNRRIAPVDLSSAEFPGEFN